MSRGRKDGKPPVAKDKKRRMPDQPLDPRIKKMILSGGLVALVAVVVYVFYSAATASPEGTVEFVDINDRARLHEVFRDGRPWVLQCLNPNAPQVTEGMEKAAAAKPRGVRFGTIDCAGKLPSGKSVFERFHVSRDMKPAPVFLVHSGLPVVHPTWPVAKNGAQLAKWAADTSEPKVIRISDHGDIKNTCLRSRKTCVVVTVDDKAGSAPAGHHSHQVLKTVRALSRRWRLAQFSIVSPTAAKIGPLRPRLGASPADDVPISNEGTVTVLTRAATDSAATAAFTVAGGKKGAKGGAKADGDLHYAVTAHVLGTNLLGGSAREASAEMAGIMAGEGKGPIEIRALPEIARVRKPPRVIDAAAEGKKKKNSKGKQAGGAGNGASAAGETLDDEALAKRKAEFRKAQAEKERKVREELEKEAEDAAFVKAAEDGDGDEGYVSMHDDDEEVESIDLD